ncbi:MAG: hypothetical protein KDI62_25275, partial [Anaerolineae bacterium]|nr:hypothetical protein [Anaerolineae bacterium]
GPALHARRVVKIRQARVQQQPRRGDGLTALKLTWSGKVCFDPTMNDKVSFVAPAGFRDVITARR